MSDLIRRYGIDRARRELKAMDDRSVWMISSCLNYREEVRAEIADYDMTDHCTDIRNHLSTNTLVKDR